VKTPVPFLLKHTLREYQHVAVDWLVTLHDKKLNGILADEMGLGTLSEKREMETVVVERGGGGKRKEGEVQKSETGGGSYRVRVFIDGLPPLLYLPILFPSSSPPSPPAYFREDDYDHFDSCAPRL